MAKVRYFIESLEINGNKVTAKVKFKSSTDQDSPVQHWEMDLVTEEEGQTHEKQIKKQLSLTAKSWDKQVTAEEPIEPVITEDEWVDA